MIVPVRCFTCGMVLCDKWNAYVARVDEREAAAMDSAAQPPSGSAWAANGGKGPRAVRGRVLDELGITKLCCRRHMLSNADVLDLL